MVTEDICKNVQSVVFHYFSSMDNDEELRHITMKLANAFNHLPGHGLKEVSLHDASGAELAKYTYGVAKRKYFVLAVWPWAALLDRPPTTDHRPPTTDHRLQTGEIAVLNRKFFYRACASDVFPLEKEDGTSNALNTIEVSFSSAEEPFVSLLTNDADDFASQKEAVSNFLLNWPGLLEEGQVSFWGGVDQGVKPPMGTADFLTALGASPALPQGTAALRQGLDRWGQHYFFGFLGDFIDEKVMQESFYDLDGYWQEDSQYLAVSFILPSGYPHTEQLKNAVTRVNQQVVRDPRGRRVFLRLAS